MDCFFTFFHDAHNWSTIWCSFASLYITMFSSSGRMRNVLLANSIIGIAFGILTATGQAFECRKESSNFRVNIVFLEPCILLNEIFLAYYSITKCTSIITEEGLRKKVRYFQYFLLFVYCCLHSWTAQLRWVT